MSPSRTGPRGSGRTILLAILGLAIGTAGAIAFLFYVTEDGPGTPAAPRATPAESAPPPPAAATEAATGRRTVNLNPPEPPPPPLVISPAPPKAPPGTWGAVPAVSNARALGPAGAPVYRGLAALTGQFSACFSSQVARMDDSSDLPSLLLNLETRTNEVAVVDASPMNEGGATAELLGCAILAVKGRTFPAPGIKPGQKLRLIHPISP